MVCIINRSCKQKYRQSVANKVFFAGAVVDTTVDAYNSGISVADEVAYQLRNFQSYCVCKVDLSTND